MASQKIDLQTCKECNEKMFPVYTPRDGEFITCPLCMNWCDRTKAGVLEYCTDCNILFNIGCIHGQNDSGNCYNAALMVGFIENKKEYKGMLVFDNKERAKEFIQRVLDKHIQVIMHCMCAGESNVCREASIKTEVQKCTYN